MVSRMMDFIIKGAAKREKNLSAEGTTVGAIRKKYENNDKIAKIPGNIKRHHLDINGISGLMLVHDNSPDDSIILYLHGGAYIYCSAESHKGLAGQICQASEISALLINYRLAPEHPFPAALEDAVETYRYLLSESRYSPDKIIIAGDSAGGGLALSAVLKLRECNLPLPAGLVMLSPWADLEGTGVSYRANMEIDAILDPDDLARAGKIYLNGADGKNPLASPLYGDLSGLPPVYIQAGSSEILLDDSVRLAERIRAVGGSVELDIFEEMVHVFQLFGGMKFIGGLLPECKKAYRRIGEFIRDIFSSNN